MNVCVEKFSSKMALNDAINEELYLPATIGWNLLTSFGCLDQTGHNGFKVQKDYSAKLFVLLFAFVSLCLLVYSASPTYLCNSMGNKKKLTELFYLGEVPN